MFGEDYGKLVSHDGELIHTAAIMSFPRALATIRAQHSILRALCQVVDNIVTDSAPSGNSKWKNLVLNLNQKAGETRWTFYEHPALVPPYGFDTKTLLDKATNKFNELCDDIQLMQTDPEYMLNAALSRKANIRCHDTVPTTIRWNYVALDLFGNRFPKLVHWARIRDACRVLHEVFEEHGAVIRPGKLLPHEVGSALNPYYNYINEAVETHCELFRDSLAQMSALKGCFEIVKEDGKYVWKHLRPLDPSKESDRLLATAVAIKNIMKARPMCGARTQVRLFLGKLSSIKYEQAIDEEISSLALLDELRLAHVWSQLGPFRMTPQQHDMSLKAKAAGESRSSFFYCPPEKVMGQFTDTMQHPISTRLSPLLRKFCEAPWPKDHKSLTWLNKVTESRECLSNLWEAAREVWKAMEEDVRALDPKMQQLIDSMSFDTTPEYLDEVRKEREEGEAEIQRMQANQSRQDSTVHVLQTAWGHTDGSEIGRKFDQPQRTKIKTTGANTADHLDISALSLGDGEASQDSNEGMPAAEIPVRQESLVLFRKMFPSSTGSPTGSVKWTHLVQALTDAGLVVT